MKYVKLLTLPFTLFLSYQLPYWLLTLMLVSVREYFDLYWVWWWVGLSFALGGISIMVAFPAMIYYWFLTFVVQHSERIINVHKFVHLCGIIVWVVMQFYSPPTLVSGSTEIGLLQWAWEESVVKTMGSLLMIISYVTGLASIAVISFDDH